MSARGRYKTSAARKEVLRLHYRGLTPLEIAEELGKSLGAVCMMLSRLGLKKNKRPGAKLNAHSEVSKRYREIQPLPRGRRRKGKKILRELWAKGESTGEIIRVLHTKVQIRLSHRDIYKTVALGGFKKASREREKKPRRVFNGAYVP